MEAMSVTGTCGDIVIDGTLDIGANAFKDFVYFVGVDAGTVVGSIGASAFQNTIITGQLYLPNNANTYGDNCFSGMICTTAPFNVRAGTYGT